MEMCDMTNEEAAKLLALIKIAYPTSYRDLDEDSTRATIAMWKNTFADVPYVILTLAFENFRRRSKYPPTIAEMYEELQHLYYIAIGDRSMAELRGESDARSRFVMEQTSRFRGDNIPRSIEYSYITDEMLLEAPNVDLLEGGD
jgi:hypothetical protein